jgi:hypothetical protein
MSEPTGQAPPSHDVDISPHDFGGGLKAGLFAEGLNGSSGYGPRTITVSPTGKLITVVLDNGHMLPGGSEMWGINHKQIGYLQGRLLTLIDATFSDPVQRKAHVDLVKSEFKAWVTAISEEAQYDANPRFTGGRTYVGDFGTELAPE